MEAALLALAAAGFLCEAVRDAANDKLSRSLGQIGYIRPSIDNAGKDEAAASLAGQAEAKAAKEAPSMDAMKHKDEEDEEKDEKERGRERQTNTTCRRVEGYR